tara:strand:+ start:1008 stop:1217 length:210 start_codon:yes stop_codon:yes gene_type:complete
MVDSITRSDLMGIIERALEDFSEIQINLKSKAARDAIALRIASDIAALNYSSDMQDADEGFKELQRKFY